jgi:hypothetical protein
VDRVADYMASMNELTTSALYRKELGLTWTEEQDIRRRVKAEKAAKQEKEEANA